MLLSKEAKTLEKLKAARKGAWFWGYLADSINLNLSVESKKIPEQEKWKNKVLKKSLMPKKLALAGSWTRIVGCKVQSDCHYTTRAF